VSKKILFILSGDRNKASSRVRAFWIADEFQRRGIQCTLRWDDSRLGILKLAFEIPSHDVIIFQKTYSRYHRWLMAFAKALGKKTYLDIDDAPSRINSPITLANFFAMCRMANGVFAGSRNLVELTQSHQPKSYLIPSSIKLENYSPIERKESHAEICVGWIGNGAHYKDDLIRILKEPLIALAQKHPLRFKLIGACGVRELYDAFGSIPNLALDFVDQIEWENPVAVAESIRAMDIGLYPLLENASNPYKCGFKALEYMAMKIPVVASPVANNAEIVEDGVTGYLVTTPDEWIARLDELIADAQKRIRMGERGRCKVETAYNLRAISNNAADIMGLG
jgi:glycosyltransferase involved in cell wall biosynthesis